MNALRCACVALLALCLFRTTFAKTKRRRCNSGLRFPSGFQFGAASAAYQVEGGWNASDKSESIWDHLTHTVPSQIPDGSNGDVACDSYHKYKTDVQMAKSLGLTFYRMSLSWPRILPSGYPNKISEDGKRYYNALIDELIANGLTPLVTLYHWDLPQSLQDLGGWTNPLIETWFGDYARVCFQLFGDRVTYWMTINEPIAVCDVSYESGLTAPAILSPGIGNLLCNKNLLMAHARAYRIYDQEFRSTQKGRVSIVNLLFYYEAATPDDEDLTELVRQYGIGRYCHAIFSSEGGWPSKLKEYMAEKSKNEGYSYSRLPDFNQTEIDFIKGTYDFFGFNFYTCRVVRRAQPGDDVGDWPFGGVPELNAVLEGRPQWKPGGTFWFLVCPEGMRKMLNWITDNYGPIEILITENGYPTTVEVDGENSLNDVARVDYYKDHLTQMLLAVTEDGADVFGYTAWTLMDNFEWFDGYNTKFGLYEVDFSSPNRTRTIRKSGIYYRSVIKNNAVMDPQCVSYD